MNISDLKVLLEVIDVKAQSKSNEDPHDANLRRWKEKCSFITVMVCLIGLLIGLALYVFFRPDSKNEGIALSGAISIVMGMSGYYLKEIKK